MGLIFNVNLRAKSFNMIRPGGSGVCVVDCGDKILDFNVSLEF